MRRRHKKFNAHRFLDKFQGQESILQAFVRLFADSLSLDAESVNIDGFKAYLASDSDDPGWNEFLEELYLVHDMSSGQSEQKERCQEELIEACRQMSPPYNPDPKGALPVECLAMKVRAENPVAFEIAYDMHAFHHVDGFSEYQGAVGVPVDDPDRAAAELQAELETTFAGTKSSDRVKVSHYMEDGSVNFVIYHEKRTVSELVFDRGRNVSAQIFRPLGQGFIGYHADTGKLKLKAANKGERQSIRRAFAGACLNDEDFFDRDGAANRINLARLLADDFLFNTRDGDQAYLYEIYCNLKQKHAPRMMLRSKNVFETLDLNRLRSKVAADKITRAVIYIQFVGEKRPLRIELSGTNGMKIPQSLQHDAARAYLIEWGLLND